MARKVFFSFHFERDVHRVVQVRNSWIIRAKGEAPPFYDKAEFEEVKRRSGGIKNWIDEQMKGTSVTVVLFGATTYERPWVQYEIRKSFELRKGILAVDIHNVKHPQKGADIQGQNPLAHLSTQINGQNVSLNRIYSTYDYERDNGYLNMSSWIEAAAKAVGR